MPANGRRDLIRRLKINFKFSSHKSGSQLNQSVSLLGYGETDDSKLDFRRGKRLQYSPKRREEL